MKIRSVTYFFNPHWPSHEEALGKAGAFIAAARPAYEATGYEVQTTRLATVSFSLIFPRWETSEIVELAQTLESRGKSLGYDYLSLGSAVPQVAHSYSVIPDILSATQATFLSGVMASSSDGISLPAIRACAEIIYRAARLSPDGFSNLRFAALANVPPGSPFFPAAYHGGDRPTFALATEAADLAVEVISQAKSLLEARQKLIAALESHATVLTAVGENLAEQFGLPFGGIDFSLAPFPDEGRSLGTAMERLGVPAVGLHGSLAAAAFLADTLDRAQFHRAGFSGLMLPVLEDAVLAARAAESGLTIEDLLLYSAVCGAGLDTLPLPGDITTEQLQAILLDLAALAQRLEKPLTARLMPIPGKSAGDPTGFSFAYFANSRVLNVNALPLKGFFAGDEVFAFKRAKFF